MKQTPAPEITVSEIEALLKAPTEPTIPRAAWVERLVSERDTGLDVEALCEVAAEPQPGGTLATIRGLLEGVLARHCDDDATVAALAAVLDLHLPSLTEK